MLRKRSSSSVSSSPGVQTTMGFEENSSTEPSALGSGGRSHQQISTNHGGLRAPDWEAGASLAKAILGAGSFALPWAVSKMGYVAGPCWLILFLGLSVRSIALLVKAARQLRKQQQPQPSGHRHAHLTYVDVARAAFGSTGASLAYGASLASSIGVCGSYLVFVATNLEALWGTLRSMVAPGAVAYAAVGASEKQEPPSHVLPLVWCVALPIAAALSSVRDAHKFAMVALWGDLSVVGGMVAVVVYGLMQQNSRGGATDPESRLVALGSLSETALALGSIGYLFLVHFLVLPIESTFAAAIAGRDEGLDELDRAEAAAANQNSSAASTSTQPHRFETVVAYTFGACGITGGLFGLVGYGLFGADTQQIVLLNVEGSWGMVVVQSLLCADLLLTYPVVMRPSIQIVEEHWSNITKRRRSPRQKARAQDETQSDAFHSNILRDRFEEQEALMTAMPPRGASSTTTKRSTTTVTTNHNNNNNNNNNNNPPPNPTHRQDDSAPPTSSVTTVEHLAVCGALGVVAAAAASLVPAFGILSGLVGGVSQTFLAFVLPPLLWAKLVVVGVPSSQQQQQPQGPRPPDPTPTLGACLASLPWTERALVVCGLGLIAWTLHGTWVELGYGRSSS